MTFLADENVPGFAVRYMRNAGYAVDWIAETAPGSSDRQVLDLAVANSRILLTLDKDFGELAVRHESPAPFGIVLIRVADSDPTLFLARLTEWLRLKLEAQGALTVISRDRVRVRPLR